MIAAIIYLLWVLAILAAIILIAPIHFYLEGELAESLSYQGRVDWAGGIFKITASRRQGKTQWVWSILGLEKQISTRSGKEIKNSKANEKDKPKTSKRRKKDNASIASFLKLEFLRAVKDSLHKLMRRLHLKLNLSGVYGFDDPSLTGIVLGLLCALNISNSSINIEPDFTGEVIDLTGSFQGWLIPLQIMGTAVGILLMKPVRAIWWPRIKFRKKQKEAVKYA